MNSTRVSLHTNLLMLSMIENIQRPIESRSYHQRFIINQVHLSNRLIAFQPVYLNQLIRIIFIYVPIQLPTKKRILYRGHANIFYPRPCTLCLPKDFSISKIRDTCQSITGTGYHDGTGTVED